MPDNRPRVGLARCPDYDLARVRAAVEATLAPFGGMGAFVKAGDRVLLKPNLVMGRAPDAAVNTHPAVVEAVGGLVRDCGGRVLVGDSPGLGAARRAAGPCGILDAVGRLGGEMLEFTVDEAARLDAPALGGLDMAREIREVDVHINLPKCKTHVLTRLTLAVKNCFGCIVGPRKFQWHYRAGHDHALFAKMLVDVCRRAAPDLHVLDGVVGMEGQGPTSGTPRPLGWILSGTDRRAVDAAAPRLVGCEPADLPTLAAAGAGDAPPPAWLDPEVAGEAPADLAVSDLQFPRAGRSFRDLLPPFLSSLLRRFVTAWPEPIPDRCTGCGACARLCPAGAITMTDGRPVIDAGRCIRCCCCHELCPEHALTMRRPVLARWLSKG